jgi:FtsZ-interacting cell division protein ZipA
MGLRLNLDSSVDNHQYNTKEYKIAKIATIPQIQQISTYSTQPTQHQDQEKYPKRPTRTNQQSLMGDRRPSKGQPSQGSLGNHETVAPTNHLQDIDTFTAGHGRDTLTEL